MITLTGGRGGSFEIDFDDIDTMEEVDERVGPDCWIKTVAQMKSGGEGLFRETPDEIRAIHARNS